MIPFYRHCCGEEEIAAAARVLRSDWLTMGPEVDAFEQEAAEVLGMPKGWKCLAVSSCTAGLYILAKLLDLEGAKIMVPDLTFAATLNAMLAAGAMPMVVDVDERGLLDTHVFEGWADAAVMVTFAGIVPDRFFPWRPDVEIIYDQAHSFQPGAWRPNSSWSFFPTKNLTAGEGGLITVPEDLVDDATALRNHGRKSTYKVSEWGALNHRMTDLQAAILRAQLEKLPWIMARKAEIAAMYRAELGGSGLLMPPEGVTHLFWVRHPYRDRLQAGLKQAGIETSIHYRPLHQLGLPPGVLSAGSLTKSAEIASQTLSLPFWPGLTDAEVHEIIEETLKMLDQIGE